MDSLFFDMQEILLNSSHWGALVVVAGTLFLGCMGVPVNTDFVLLFTGVLTSFGHFNSYELIPVAIMAITIGDLSLFLLVQKYGPKLMKFRLMQKALNPSRIGKVEKFLERYGNLYILFIRLFPGTRSLSFTAIATLQFPVRRFFVFNFIAVCGWVFFVHFLGISAGNHYQEWLVTLQVYQKNILLLLITMIFTWGVFYLIKTRRPRDP